MNYMNITKDDMLNGDGIRVVLWVAGCSHACKGCQNPETWNCNNGIPFDEEAYEEIMTELSKDYVSGITFSGGDPLFEGNRETVLSLMTAIKDKFPKKTIWLYTGYLYNEIADLPHMKFCDVIVDGEYMEELRDVSLPWRGSTNQNVIYLKRKDGEI